MNLLQILKGESPTTSSEVKIGTESLKKDREKSEAVLTAVEEELELERVEHLCGGGSASRIQELTNQRDEIRERIKTFDIAITKLTEIYDDALKKELNSRIEDNKQKRADLSEKKKVLLKKLLISGAETAAYSWLLKHGPVTVGREGVGEILSKEDSQFFHKLVEEKIGDKKSIPQEYEEIRQEYVCLKEKKEEIDKRI